MDQCTHLVHFDQKQLSKCISSAKLRKANLSVPASIISILVQEHGSVNLDQTVIFTALFFNNESDNNNSGSFVPVAKKILLRQMFSALEICASLRKLSIIKGHLLWLDEHPTTKTISLSYGEEKRISRKIQVDQQRELFIGLRKCILLYADSKEFDGKLGEISKEIYNIPKRIIVFMFQVNIRGKDQESTEKVIETATFCRNFRGMHWTADDAVEIVDSDLRQIVKKLLTMKIGSETDQRICNHIGEEIFGKIDGSQNKAVSESIRRLYKVSPGLLSIIMNINPNIKSIQELIAVATFCGFFREDRPDYDDSALLSIRPSVTGKDLSSHLRNILQNLLWKLSIIHLQNDRHWSLYTSLVKQILGNVEIRGNNLDTITDKIKNLYISRQRIVLVIMNILKERQNIPDFLKLTVTCSYICYQYDCDRQPSTAESCVIRHLTKIMLASDPEIVVTSKTEEENLKKIAKEKFKISDSIVDLIFNVDSGRQFFQKSVMCSFFENEVLLENRVSAAVSNLCDDNIKELTISEKRILFQIAKIIEDKKENERQEGILKEIVKSIELKKLENTSSCPVM